MTRSHRVVAGAQRPRIESLPTSAYYDLGEDTIALCSAVGLELDDWQAYVVRGMLGERLDGKFSASRVGIVVPRQQGKGVVLEARALAGLFLLDEPYIIWTAHELKTAQAAFLRLRGWIDGSPDLVKHVRQYYTGNTENSIILKDGRTLRFMARTKGSGRGFTASTLILDEAYALKQSELAALLPTLTTAENPQTIYASSAGLHDSEVLEDLRREGVAGASKGLAYFEWSAPDEADSDDLEALQVANPGLGVRLSLDHVATERAAMSEEEFRRERLGIWAKLGGDSALDARLWARQLDDVSQPGGRLVFGLDVSPSRDSAAISVVSEREDGKFHVELVDYRVGTDWVVERARQLQEAWEPDTGLVIDAGSGAGSLVPELVRSRVKVLQVTGREYWQACGLFYDEFQRGNLAHIGQEQLDEAVGNVKIKPKGDSLFTWARVDQTVPISPWVAGTLAFAGLNKTKKRVPGKSGGSGWKVVAL